MNLFWICLICRIIFISSHIKLSLYLLLNVDMSESHVSDGNFCELDSLDEISDGEYGLSKDEVHICTFEECDKTFTRLDRLIQHQRIHTGEVLIQFDDWRGLL